MSKIDSAKRRIGRVRKRIGACLVSLCFAVNAFSEPMPTITWLRPTEASLELDDTRIIGGHHYETLQFIAKQLSNFKHRFESYPVRRSFLMVKEEGDSANVFCFHGAAYKEEREEWGVYSQPTAIGLPYIIVAKKGALPTLDDGNTVVVTSLFKQGYRTVLYDKVSNVWVDLISGMNQPDNVLNIAGINTDLNLHTIELILKDRIDFGYIALRDLANIEHDQSNKLTTYTVAEFKQQVRPAKRILCSNTILGEKAVKAIDEALITIKNSSELSASFAELNFKADSYAPVTKPLYKKLWKQHFTKQILPQGIPSS